MSSTEQYTAIATQVRQATEKSVETTVPCRSPIRRPSSRLCRRWT